MSVIRRRLGWKLFLSYLVIILVGVLTLAMAAQASTPTALARHAARMESALGMMQMMGVDAALIDDLNQSFVTAVNEILAVAAIAALITAIIVSTYVTRRIVGPVQKMQQASQRIAAGDYDERVEVTGADELAALAHSLNNMAEQLADIEVRRRELIGDVAHELRTPLGNVKSVMEGLVDGVLEPEPAVFQNIELEVTRLQGLVRDLEELSRAESGQIILEREHISPADFIMPAVERLRLQFEDKGVALEVILPPELLAVHVDPWRMTQVMLNLLGNALQYTPFGGTVKLSVEAGRHQLTICIADTGIGIPAEHLPHIFERFYRVDKSRSRTGGGSGIGLTISKHLIEANGGRLVAASPGLNQGSTFSIILPVKT